MNLIQSHGRVSNVALKPSVAFGGQYEDFVAALNSKVKPARSSGKVALAIPLTLVAKTKSATITLKPLVDFKGEQLILADATGAFASSTLGITIDSIKVGRDEQFVAAGAVPAAVFSQLVRRSIGLNMKTCPTSLSITLTVTNHDSATDHYLGGMFIGQCGACNEDACGVSVDMGDTYEPLVALAIPATNVLAGATTTIPVAIEVPFTGQQLVIPTTWYDATNANVDAVSANFSIVSIKVGRDEMLTSVDPIPAAVFGLDSQRDIGLSMKKCPTQLTINVTVKNLDAGAPHEFVGAFYGFCGDNGNCNTGLCTDFDIGVAAPVRNFESTPAGLQFGDAARRFLAMQQAPVSAIR